jgi:hypothetical protein
MLIKLPKFVLKKKSKIFGHVHVAAHWELVKEKTLLQKHFFVFEQNAVNLLEFNIC